MHAGNLFSFICAWLFARKSGGELVLRIEDLDRDRCKPHYSEALCSDLKRFGLTWEYGVFHQQDHDDRYREVYEELSRRAHVYPCFCTRADLSAARAPHAADYGVYPGTCRNLTLEQCRVKANAKQPAYRIEVPDSRVTFEDALCGPCAYDLTVDSGDFIIRRADGSFSYQLAVVVDDHDEGVTQVVRGRDLLHATAMQYHLADLLGFMHPDYIHIPLFVDEEGRRLAKRDRSAHVGELLAIASAERIIGHIAFLAGMIDRDEAISLYELLKEFDGEVLRGKEEILWTELPR